MNKDCKYLRIEEDLTEGIIPENQALEDLKSNNNQQGQYGKAPASAVQQPAYQGNTNSLIDANIGLSEKDLANQSLFNM